MKNWCTCPTRKWLQKDKSVTFGNISPIFLFLIKSYANVVSREKFSFHSHHVTLCMRWKSGDNRRTRKSTNKEMENLFDGWQNIRSTFCWRRTDAFVSCLHNQQVPQSSNFTSVLCHKTQFIFTRRIKVYGTQIRYWSLKIIWSTSSWFFQWLKFEYAS